MCTVLQKNGFKLLAAGLFTCLLLSSCASNTPKPTDTPTPTEAPAPTNTPTQTPTPTLGVGSTQVSPKDNMVMVYVPAGEFEMGSEDGEKDEKPVHTIHLDAFWIDKHEVTNAQYAAFLNDMGNQSEGGVTWLVAGGGDERIHQTGGEWAADLGYSDHPVVEVSWYGASAYCEWAGRQLPTEAEWEKAARGEDGRTYPWGEGVNSSLANYDHNVGGTTAVGSYLDGASPYGVLDMAGNVWEWVADWWGSDYYSNSPSEDPQGPSSGEYSRVLRGGSWLSGNWSVRSAHRNWYPPDLSNPSLGFRCVTSP